MVTSFSGLLDIVFDLKNYSIQKTIYDRFILFRFLFFSFLLQIRATKSKTPLLRFHPSDAQLKFILFKTKIK